MILTSCAVKNGNTEGSVIARVGDYYLQEIDLDGIIPSNTTTKDSLTITRNFINTWIREKLLLLHAQKNLTEDQMNFDKQIEAYRNSLIVYQYESLLIKQQLDNEITDAEIEDYYDKNRSNFELKQNIVKADFVIIDHDSPQLNSIKSLFKSDDPTAIDSLETYCELYAHRYHISSEQWFSFNEILKIIPIETYNQQAFLKNNHFIELQDDVFQYYVKIWDFNIKDELSPLSFERENIKSIILNRRKIELINKMHNQLFEDALNSDIVEIY